MNYQKDNCSECGVFDYIVNKKYRMCNNCNQNRLHGSDWKERQREKKARQMNAMIKKSSLLQSKRQASSKSHSKPKKRLNSISSKNKYACSDGSSVTQQQINSKYSEAVKMIDISRSPICETCGRGGVALSHSHIISKKRAKEIGKADLIWDENNILIECYDDGGSNSTSCHNIWEYGSLEDKQLQSTYLQKLAIIKEYDPEQYTKLTT